MPTKKKIGKTILHYPSTNQTQSSPTSPFQDVGQGRRKVVLGIVPVASLRESLLPRTLGEKNPQLANGVAESEGPETESDEKQSFGHVIEQDPPEEPEELDQLE